MDDLDLDPEMTEGEADRLVRLSIGFAASTVVTCAFGAVSAVVIALLARDHCSPRLKPLVDLTLVGAPLLAVLQVGLVAVWAMSEPSAEAAATPGTVLTLASPPGPSPTRAEAEQASADCAAGKAAYLAGDRDRTGAHSSDLWSNTNRWNLGHAAMVLGGSEALKCRELLQDLIRGEVGYVSGAEHLAAKRYYQASVAWAGAEEVLRPHSSHVDVGPMVTKRLSEFARLRKTHAAAIRRDKRNYDEQVKREAEAEALKIVCGPTPQLAMFSDTYAAVKSYLKRVAHDPKSIDVVACTPAVLTTSCWETQCDWRGRNRFGAMGLDTNTFYIGVAGVLDVK